MSNFKENIHPRNFFNKVDFSSVVLFFAFISIFLFPPLKYNFLNFKIEFTDLLIPFVLLLLRNKISFRSYYAVFIAYALYIMFVIFYNDRINKLQDYFEIYKLIKLLIYILFFSVFIDKIKLRPLLDATFITLLIFNLFHYYNIFYFNHYIEPFYASPIHLETFGLNSLGLPDTKRMLGTMGNPNNNAILFLFFLIFYLPKRQFSLKRDIFFILTYFAILHCQSRTGIIAFVIIVISSFIIQRNTLKQILKYLSLITLVYVVLNIGFIFQSNQTLNSENGFGLFSLSSDNNSETEYLNNLASADLVKTQSYKGRIETWTHLWNMIKQKPLLGYAPYKEYFYKNKLYAENQYILITWRYGFIGLFIFLVLLSYPIVFYFKKHRKQNEYHKALLFSMVIFLVSMTNNPIADPKILMMYAFIISLLFNKLNKLEAGDEIIISRQQ